MSLKILCLWRFQLLSRPKTNFSELITLKKLVHHKNIKKKTILYCTAETNQNKCSWATVSQNFLCLKRVQILLKLKSNFTRIASQKPQNSNTKQLGVRHLSCEIYKSCLNSKWWNQDLQMKVTCHMTDNLSVHVIVKILHSNK